MIKGMFNGSRMLSEWIVALEMFYQYLNSGEQKSAASPNGELKNRRRLASIVLHG
jgi:hypothetical protein